MSKSEGRPDGYTRNATFHARVNTTATWQKVDFTDHNGEPFEAGHIRLENDGGGSAAFSFDPDAVSPAQVVQQGQVASTVVKLFFKRATSIWLKDLVDSPIVSVIAWR